MATGIKKDWVRRHEYEQLKQDLAHANSEVRRLSEMIEPLPFASKVNGAWNGDMLHDWIEGEPPKNQNHRRLYTIIWAYRKAEFDKGIVEGVRRAKLERVGL